MSKLYDFWCPRRAGAGKWSNWIQHYPELQALGQVFAQIQASHALNTLACGNICRGRIKLSSDMMTMIAWQVLHLNQESCTKAAKPTKWLLYWLRHANEHAYNPLMVMESLSERMKVSTLYRAGQLKSAHAIVTMYAGIHNDDMVTVEFYVNIVLGMIISMDAHGDTHDDARDIAAKSRLIIEDRQYQGGFTGIAHLSNGQQFFYHPEIPVISYDDIYLRHDPHRCISDPTLVLPKIELPEPSNAYKVSLVYVMV